MNVITSIPRPVPLPSWQHYVLVVEDDVELRDSYRAALRASGIAAVGVHDVHGAMRVLQAERPYAVVLDLTMHQQNAREVQQALKSDPQTRDIPVVLIVGSDVEDVKVDDVACLLVEPVSLDALVVAVKHVVRRPAAPSVQGRA